jgi:hypothetical protein
MAISDWVVLLATGGRIVAQGTPAELMASTDPEVRQFVRGEPDGPVKFHYPAPDMAEDFGLGRTGHERVWPHSAPGAGTLQAWGHAAIFFVDLLGVLPQALRRFGLVVHADPCHRQPVAGDHPGLGHGGGLRAGAADVLRAGHLRRGRVAGPGGQPVLVRELGPVVTALLFAGRAGTSLTAEIGLMKAGEQLAAMELMAIDPRQRVLAPRFMAGIISMPLLAILFSAIGILGAWWWRWG